MKIPQWTAPLFRHHEFEQRSATKPGGTRSRERAWYLTEAGEAYLQPAVFFDRSLSVNEPDLAKLAEAFQGSLERFTATYEHHVDEMCRLAIDALHGDISRLRLDRKPECVTEIFVDGLMCGRVSVEGREAMKVRSWSNFKRIRREAS